VLVELQPPSRAGSWRALNTAGLSVGTLFFPVVDNFDISSPCRTPQRLLRPHTLPHLDHLVGAMLGYYHLGTMSCMSSITKLRRMIPTIPTAGPLFVQRLIQYLLIGLGVQRVSWPYILPLPPCPHWRFVFAGLNWFCFPGQATLRLLWMCFSKAESCPGH
jgi:hypothetical protein